MNEIFNKLLLAGDKFLPEMHLKEPVFTYSACGPFTKSKERIQKSKETGDTKYIHQNELDKVCFQQDMAYGNFKDLARRTASDRVKAFSFHKNPKYDRYQRGLASKIKQNEQLADEFHKPIIKNLKKEKYIHHSEIIFGGRD